jgi:imidazolonepropionase-like amidohydrolase
MIDNSTISAGPEHLMYPKKLYAGWAIAGAAAACYAEQIDRMIVIDDGKITSVTSSNESPPADAKVLDLSGHTVIPGLVDADLVVLKGDPGHLITDVENVEMVFKDGIAYDSAALLQSVRARYGEY